MKVKSKYLVILVVVLCFIYLGSKLTFTSFESLIDGFVNNTVAGIKIRINGVDAMNSEGLLDNRIILDNTTWVSTHTREEKISPGSTGTIDLEIDPTGSEVAILYEFRFVDKVIDNDKLINFGNITCDSQFVRTAVDTYSGIITLADLNQNKKVNVSVDFYFDYLNDIEGIEEDNQNLDDLFEIHFRALQYRGEELVPYIGDYLYSINTNTVNYNDNVSSLGTTYQTPEDAATNFDKSVFLRHSAQNNNVSKSSVAFVKDGVTYYLQSGGATYNSSTNSYSTDSIYYDLNKGVMDTVFGSANCTESSSGYSCSGSGFNASTSYMGTVEVSSDTWSCTVTYSGASSCATT